MSQGTPPSRGEIWMVNLDPVRGHEQAGSRPALIISDDPLNRSQADLVIVIPLTTTNRRIPTHVQVVPPEGGLSRSSVILTEQIRAISKDRLGRRVGSLSPTTMRAVETRLRLVLRL